MLFNLLLQQLLNPDGIVVDRDKTMFVRSGRGLCPGSPIIVLRPIMTA